MCPPLTTRARRPQRSRPHRLQEVDLELERRERLALVERAGPGHAHRRVRDVARARRRAACPWGWPGARRPSARSCASPSPDGGEGEAEQGGDGRRRRLAAQDHPGALEHGGHDGPSRGP